jgi:ppGpp synthetase/RelA/SpoT-type nucleotidyltranferase
MASKSAVNRAGNTLRLARSEPSLIAPELKFEATKIVEDFRRGFSYPMEKVNNGLRTWVSQISEPVLVTQRLKRMSQIVHKLERMPTTNLARLEDIGGCRVILNPPEKIDWLVEKINSVWDVVRVHDYVAEPKSSGYRAQHLIVERDEHRIEVQIRTIGQQGWANVVEKIAARYQLPLKDEVGPSEVLEWLRLAAERIALRDQGKLIPASLNKSIDEAMITALLWMDEEAKK